MVVVIDELRPWLNGMKYVHITQMFFVFLLLFLFFYFIYALWVRNLAPNLLPNANNVMV